MSTAENDPQPLTEALQFDRAEYSTEAETTKPSAPTCAACKAPIHDVYFETNGQLVCAGCRDRIEASHQGGSKLARAFKAVVFGSVAAAIGACLYFGILKLTGYEFGLVAVVVGVMVGGAVKSGSGNRGGWFYQLLALFLTYSSIVAMIALTGIVEAIQHPEQALPEEAAKQVGQAEPKGMKPTPAAPHDEQAKQKAEPRADGATEETDDQAKRTAEPRGDGATEEEAGVDPEPRPGLLTWVMVTVLILGFLYSLPVQIAVASPVSGLIYSFALWEAWKINRKTRLAFNGPFRLGETSRGGAGADGSEGQGDVA